MLSGCGKKQDFGIILVYGIGGGRKHIFKDRRMQAAVVKAGGEPEGDPAAGNVQTELSVREGVVDDTQTYGEVGQIVGVYDDRNRYMKCCQHFWRVDEKNEIGFDVLAAYPAGHTELLFVAAVVNVIVFQYGTERVVCHV